jgi:hypothetical protein
VSLQNDLMHFEKMFLLLGTATTAGTDEALTAPCAIPDGTSSIYFASDAAAKPHDVVALVLVTPRPNSPNPSDIREAAAKFLRHSTNLGIKCGDHLENLGR